MSRRYWQLDVFAERPLTGNGLAVFDDASTLDDAAMQAWTRELRQFESIFLLPGDDPRAFGARIFTLEEELPFAGHPLLGAAALLHHLRGGDNEQHWTLHLASKSVALRSVRGAAVSTPRWTRAAPNSAPPRTPGPAAGSPKPSRYRPTTCPGIHRGW